MDAYWKCFQRTSQQMSEHMRITYVLSLRPQVYQERSQNAEKVTHIKGRLPDQVEILFDCDPFQNGNFS